MNDLAVIVPTRGRPGNAFRLLQAWKTTGAVCDLWFAVDQDDPQLADYQSADLWAHAMVCKSDGMAAVLNETAARVVHAGRRYVGFMGDDHLPTTTRWDHRIVAELDRLGTGIVYGNDLMQGERLPTAVFMTADIVRTLGYMCPPGFRHLYLDNCWKTWGEQLGRLAYLSDVVIEHLHPQAGGKAEWDSGYERVNSGEVWDHDGRAWVLYQAGQLQADVEKLRGLL